jgi:hypothetical protein
MEFENPSLDAKRSEARHDVSQALGDIRRHLRMQDETAARIEKHLADLSHLVTGNGTPERGIILRLDRLETIVWDMRSALRTTIAWFVRPAAGALGLMTVAAIALWICRFGLPH